MADNPHIAHVRAVAEQIGRQNDAMRASLAEWRSILCAPRPDTFLGRKTQEPFPARDDATAEADPAASDAQ